MLCTQEIALSVTFVVSIQRPVNSAKEHRFLGHPKHKNWARAILLRVVRTELRIDISEELYKPRGIDWWWSLLAGLFIVILLLSSSGDDEEEWTTGSDDDAEEIWGAFVPSAGALAKGQLKTTRRRIRFIWSSGFYLWFFRGAIFTCLPSYLYSIREWRARWMAVVGKSQQARLAVSLYLCIIEWRCCWHICGRVLYQKNDRSTMDQNTNLGRVW